MDASPGRNPSHDNLDSRQLLSFVTVAHTRSFTQAGKQLYLTQSAVSHAVKALEEELGHRLLDRNGKKLQVTPAGEHLLHYAEKILAMMSEAKAALDQRERWGAKRLRLAATGYFCSCVLPRILKSFRREFPDWPVTVMAGDTEQCLEWIEQNAIDTAIAIAPNRPGAVEMVPLFTDEIMWIVAQNHPWAKSGTVPTQEIPQQSFICSQSGSFTTRLLEKTLDRDGVRLNCRIEIADLKAVKEMVKDGAGVTALAPWAAKEELEDKSLVALPLGRRKLRRNWCLMRSPNRKANLGEEVFARISLEVAKALTPVTHFVIACINLLWLAYYLTLRAGGIECFDFDFLAVVF